MRIERASGWEMINAIENFKVWRKIVVRMITAQNVIYATQEFFFKKKDINLL